MLQEVRESSSGKCCVHSSECTSSCFLNKCVVFLDAVATREDFPSTRMSVRRTKTCLMFIRTAQTRFCTHLWTWRSCAPSWKASMLYCVMCNIKSLLHVRNLWSPRAILKWKAVSLNRSRSLTGENLRKWKLRRSKPTKRRGTWAQPLSLASNSKILT